MLIIHRNLKLSLGIDHRDLGKEFIMILFIKILSKITDEETIVKLRDTFCTWEIPGKIFSDNGPQFVLSEFKYFLMKNGIKHITTAPYDPATNGASENMVKFFKKSLKASMIDRKKQKYFSRFNCMQIFNQLQEFITLINK